MRDTRVALLLACVPLVLLRVCARAGTEHGDARDRTDGFGEGLGGEQVDRCTAKMRKRLFDKMAADGAVLLKKGQANDTTSLGGPELDMKVKCCTNHTHTHNLRARAHTHTHILNPC